MDMPAIVRLRAVHGAAVTVKSLIRVGVDAEVLDQQNPGSLKACPDETCEVEHRMPRARGRYEVARVSRVRLPESLNEFRTDFIALLPDQRADRSDGLFAP